MGEEFFGSVEVQFCGIGGGFGGGDALLGGVDGLVFCQFLLRDLCDQGFDAALCEVPTAFDGFSLGFEVVDQVGVVVLDFGDDLAFLDFLTFDDVEMFHTASDLCFDIGSAIERIESDDTSGSDDELAPWEEENPREEKSEDQGNGFRERGGDARRGGEVEDTQRGC